MNYLKIIKKQQKKKYSNYINLKKDFFKSYLSSRNNLIKKLKKKKIHKQKATSRNQVKFYNQINTEEFLKNSFLKYKYYKNLDTIKLNKIFIFYKKFETNLILRKTYNLKLSKITNNKTSINSYIYLGRLIFSLKKINNLQKLNCLIKLNDLLHLNISKISLTNTKYFLENINKEIDEIKKL